MALAPKYYKSHVSQQSIEPANTVELYVDYACPYSAILFKKWYKEIFPVLDTKYAGKVQIVFKNYIQPWHPTSTLLHEASLVVGRFQPEAFQKFSYALFDHITDFFDTETSELTRTQIYEKIYDVIIKDDKDYKFTRQEFLDALVIKKSDKPENSGNSVTNDLKYFTKVGRQNGIHVTPSVVINGFKDVSIESSTSAETIFGKFDALD